VSVAVLLLNGIKERFCAGVVEVQFLKTRIIMICAYIGSESDEVPHWIMSVQRRYVGSTHGGKSIRLECRSCRAWRGFAAAVDTAKMTRVIGYAKGRMRWPDELQLLLTGDRVVPSFTL